MFLLIILTVTTLVLIAWGRYLNYLDAFTADKKNEYKIFWFIVTGSILNTILVSIMYPLWENVLFSLTGLGYGINPFITHFLIVGPVEEFTKFLVFISLAGMFQSIKEPRDGILQAASVALGFALIENFLYALDYGIGLLLMRSILSIVGHVTYAALWGFAWSAAVYTSDKESKSPDRHYVIPFILMASMFHGAYNTLLDYGFVLFAILIKVVTLALFILIYRYVRDNSPYRKYSLKEYRRAIPALKMGLNKYPESFVLNKKMGIFNIYIRKYPDAEKYLRKAKKLNPQSPAAGFYYGAAKYLNGNTVEGMRHMNSAVNDLPASQRWKMVATLKKIISEKSRRQELMGKFNKASLQYNTVVTTPGQRQQKHISVNYRAMARLKQDRAQNYTHSASVNVSKIKPVQSQRQDQLPQRRKIPDTNRSTWDMAFNERPGPVILVPHYPNIGNRVVDRAGRSYREVLDEQVKDFKRSIKN